MNNKSKSKTWFLIIFVCLVFVMSIAGGRFIKSWKTEQETIAEVKPVVEENGDIIYTLNHIDPRGDKRVIHPWTITLPGDAYVWRKEAVEDSLPSNISVNGLRLNTQYTPNESLQFWLTMPELSFLSIDEYKSYVEEDKSLFRDGVFKGELAGIIVSAALNELETDAYKYKIFLEDKSRNNKENVIIKSSDFDMRDFFDKGNLNSYNFYYEEIKDIIRCTIRICAYTHTTKNNVRIGIRTSVEDYVEFPNIIEFLDNKIDLSVQISDEAKRSAW